MSSDIHVVQSHCLCFVFQDAVAAGDGAVCGVCRIDCCVWCIGIFVLGSFWSGRAVGDGLETKFVRGVHRLCCLRM